MRSPRQQAEEAADFTLFAEEEAVIRDAEAMIAQLEHAQQGVRALAGAYRRSYREQSRLVRLSDRMQAELQSAKQRLEEQAADLRALNAKLEEEVAQRRKLEEELRRLATVDQLTAVFTRRHFFELARREIDRRARSGQPIGVLVVDIDHFKAINDGRGHAGGDAALAHFGALLRDSVRQVDIVGRIGGEEFAVILPGAGPERAAAIAERLRQVVETTPVPLDGEPLRLTVSIGVTSFADGDDVIEKALARADEALYRAKREGRNRVVVEPACPDNR